MIRSFRNAETDLLFRGISSPPFRSIEKIALRKLIHLNQAATLRDLQMLPGNRLKALSGDRKGEYSIRINDQYRICFRWQGTDVLDVEITDYH